MTCLRDAALSTGSDDLGTFRAVAADVFYGLWFPLAPQAAQAPCSKLSREVAGDPRAIEHYVRREAARHERE